MNTGNCIQHYGPTLLTGMYIPIPPISKQEKIVNKIKVISNQLY